MLLRKRHEQHAAEASSRDSKERDRVPSGEKEHHVSSKSFERLTQGFEAVLQTGIGFLGLNRGGMGVKATGVGTWALTRMVFLRGLAFVYLVAFKIAFDQNAALIGTTGITPYTHYLDRVEDGIGLQEGMRQLPSLFWLLPRSNSSLSLIAGAGMGISAVTLLLGGANKFMMLALWLLYTSIVNVGNIWYGYGWEILLLETGFLAIWSCPTFQVRSFPKASPLPFTVRWLYRWLLFRVIVGAGLIKIRGDECWRDLTCMNYHYQTQPNPSPMSPLYNRTPELFHKIETGTNHFVELIAPILLLLPQRELLIVGGVVQIIFQLILISSGNLSFLNWLTILPAIMCFDDAFLKLFVPRKVFSQAETAQLESVAHKNSSNRAGWHVASRVVMQICLLGLISFRSYPVVLNLLNPQQQMNTSFDPWKIVNTYGAFGSITRKRVEVVLQATTDAEITKSTVWKDYEFKCKPTSINRRPCLITPYHYRLDWQLWFAGFQSLEQNPWLIHFSAKLLKQDQGTLTLIASEPFQEAPTHIRATKYLYEYSSMPKHRSFGEADEEGSWWRRLYLHEYMRPISLRDSKLLTYLDTHGFEL